MSLDDLAGYIEVPPECGLTEPAGFSNFICQYLLPYEAYFQRLGGQGLGRKKMAELALAEFAPAAAFFGDGANAKELPAALGEGGIVLAARGVAALPVCDGEDLMHYLASGASWTAHDDARSKVNYSLNIAYSANVFAMRHKWAHREQDKCAALLVSALPSRAIVGWGADGESGPLTEAELYVKPTQSYGHRGFMLGKRLPYKKCSKATCMEFGLGYYVLATARDQWQYDRIPVTLKLHPRISERSRALLTRHNFRVQDIEVSDPRQWYEVDL